MPWDLVGTVPCPEKGINRLLDVLMAKFLQSIEVRNEVAAISLRLGAGGVDLGVCINFSVEGGAAIN